MLRSQFSRFFIILVPSFVLLILISNTDKVQTFHGQYYASFGGIIINLINPHVYAEFSNGAPANENDWDFTFKIWDKRKFDERIFLKNFREANPPRAILFQSIHQIVLVPTLFLLALMFASPISIIQKFIRISLGLIIFYIFVALYLSYRFELTLNSQSLPLDSIWHVIISFFGLGGNTDPIFIVAMLIWIVLATPVLYRKYDWSKLLAK